MPYDWNVDRTTCRFFVRGHGEGTTEDALRLIAEMRDTLRECPDYDVLYDSTELRIHSSPADMMRVANALFRDAGGRFRRFALVVPNARVPLARIFVALAHPFGIMANVFNDADTARDWLAVRREQQPPAVPES